MNTKASEEGFTKGEAWGYGLGASFIVSLIGFIMSGILLLILRSKRLSLEKMNSIVMILIAFAVGALLGDALVHIVPEVFGAHEHGEVHDDHDHDHEEAEPISTISSLIIVGGFVTFMLIDRLFEKLGTNHKHTSPPPPAIGSEMEAHANLEIQFLEERNSQPMPFKEKYFSLKGRKSSGIMILLADFLHNTMDGLAIGVSFTSGDKGLAVSTFIAIVAHEVPQELGDMGVLVGSNFPLMQALCCNGFCNFSAMIGAVIGLAVGTVSEVVNAYILAFVAGNFIYIALVSMLPIVTVEKRSNHSLGLLIAFIVGVGTQFAVLAAE